MTDGKKDQLKRKKTLEYELRRLYRAGELTDQQIAELKEAEFPFDAPVRRTAKSVVRIDDGKRWPSCSAAEKELGILMIVYGTWCGKLEAKCKASSMMLSRILLLSISVIALEFGAVLFYSTLSATDQKSISLERAFRAMREDGAVSGTAVLTDIDPGCRAELNGFKPYLDTRIEVFNGQNGQKNVLAEAGKALSSGNLSAICDDYGMDYAVLNYGINDAGIQDLKESGFKTVYSDDLTVCLKRNTV